ncbi:MULTISPECIES: phycobilisome rod-core linker polypeptide [Prochlorococcus]|uniref:Phycoerythrin class III gamma chain n=2 Tax=Prochlorococcus marinus TaxID=1219 RepID=G3XCS3_PROMA|nr:MULTISPECIES: phycobilisome rod-core linker polypeptide [Prochlorococcus]CAB06827.2 phycoerythrin class III gamma chain [Prochlorococcus marinus]AAP99391.1 Phycoerythrin class III gamma chain [Prochlorococcus marinus subsp. marinus str. CCMP1375]KGG11338.1 Phycoerythrin gamma chain linker polypeptide [Prochlorococcus marinus str. LG]KGG18707.1 Phycoerythrin gamma chain linker polypeptide [Prochlorococcus marinus str. SS2]KGG22980.1 Phycoerythrin gamma chain linker polypeptide [Prochlorococc
MKTSKADFISRHSLEVKLSDISKRESFSYGKTRVSGSKQTTYIMHSRSVYMPGQEKLFTSNYPANPNQVIDKEMIQLRNIYKRKNYINSKQPIGSKTIHRSQDAFTYKRFAPISDEALEIAVVAAYKQIFGNLNPMESERPKELERRLRNGDIPIREFIRSLAKSEFYSRHFIERVSQIRSVELRFMHLLGRPLKDESELINNINFIREKGFESHIDSLMNSLEYEEHFGEDIVPFQRHWNSPCGSTTSSFIKTALFRKGFASSDNVIYK